MKKKRSLKRHFYLLLNFFSNVFEIVDEMLTVFFQIALHCVHFHLYIVLNERQILIEILHAQILTVNFFYINHTSAKKETNCFKRRGGVAIHKGLRWTKGTYVRGQTSNLLTVY